MGFLGKLRDFFIGGGAPATGSSSDPNGLWFYFRCKNCGDVVRIRVHRGNDLNRAEEEGPGTFVLRKEVMDDTCFRVMQAELWLDGNYNLVTSEIKGGELITAEQYEAAQNK